MKKAVILMAFCMFSSVAHADGEGLKIWKSFTRGEKYAFVLGCISQAPLRCVSMSKQFVCEKGVDYKEFYNVCMKNMAGSKATAQQIVDEMDKFYQNKNNKNAPIGKAFSVAEDTF